MRWFLKLSQIPADAGLRKLQSAVCLFTVYNQGEFEGALLVHVGDLLFNGATQYHALAIRTLK